MGYSISVRSIAGSEEQDKKIKGLASVVIDNSFKINNVAIVNGENGLFVAMPALKSKDSYNEVCHPIDRNFREKLYNDILTTYAVAAANEDKSSTFATLDSNVEPDFKVWSVSLANDSNRPSLKGMAKIALNDNFIVENIPIRENNEGEAFLAMPSYKNKTTGDFHDIVYPVTKEFREKLQQVVLEKYEKAKDMKVNLLDGNEEKEDKSAIKSTWEEKIKTPETDSKTFIVCYDTGKRFFDPDYNDEYDYMPVTAGTMKEALEKAADEMQKNTGHIYPIDYGSTLLNNVENWKDIIDCMSNDIHMRDPEWERAEHRMRIELINVLNTEPFPTAILEDMVNQDDEYWSLRVSVARSHNTPAAILEKLSKDEIWEVREAAVWNNNNPLLNVDKNDEKTSKTAWEEKIKKQKDVAAENGANNLAQEQKVDIQKGNFER